MDIVNELKKALNLDAIYGIDIETYWDNDYSLRKLATTEYINDERFELQLVSVMKDTWTKPRVFTEAEFIGWAKNVDFSRAGMLAHHTQFDGYAMWRHQQFEPAFYFDTLSMARPLMSVDVGGSLKAVCAALGRKSKVHAQALTDVKGKYMNDFTKAELKALKVYAGDDIEDCWFIFRALAPYIPLDEFKLIDMTIRMYARPSLMLDKHVMAAVRDNEIARKAPLLESLGLQREDLLSNQKFVELLEAAGGTAPTKISPRTNQPTYALAKNDLAFKKLLTSENPKVRALVEARLAIKSTMLETRADRMANRADGWPTPVYLKYWGAKTGRWSGGDSANWQNMKRISSEERIEQGAPITLREGIIAPKGCSLVIADLSQIEARLLAWQAGQDDVVDAFRHDKDVYALQASKIYGRTINKHDDPNERFVGKVAVLALGYGAGAGRFAEMLRIGAFGPPVEITDLMAQSIVSTWRRHNSSITRYWNNHERVLRSAFSCNQRLSCGLLNYVGANGNGFTELPMGLGIRYDGFQLDEMGKMSYMVSCRHLKSGEKKPMRRCIYGGLIAENNTQALARSVVAFHMLQLQAALPYARIATMTHDEVVMVVPNAKTKQALAAANDIMTTAPEWAKGLPLGVDAHVSKRYDK